MILQSWGFRAFAGLWFGISWCRVYLGCWILQGDKVQGLKVYSFREFRISGLGLRTLEDFPHAQPVVADFNSDSLNDILVVDGTWEGSELLYFERLPNGSLEERWDL